ncbi:MAG: AAA family ATPase [Bacteroidia bacterium]|jgi:predicted ATPase|nr:AAA family ATPase [Bacteroidia bacterium]
MIKSIRLQNFFSFRDETIEFNPGINVLIGINGSGKSNIFKAIELLQHAIAGNDLKPLIIDNWGGVNAIINAGSPINTPVTLCYTLDDPSPLLREGRNQKELQYTLVIERQESNGLFIISEKIILNQPGQGFAVHLTTDRGKLINVSAVVDEKWEDIKPFFHEDEEYSSVFKKITSWSDTKKNHSGAMLIQLIQRLKDTVQVYDSFPTHRNSALREPIYATAEKRLAKGGENLAQVLNYLKDEEQEHYLEIEKSLERINAHFTGLDFSAFMGKMELKLREKGLKRSIPLAHISDGTLRYLCLMAIIHNPKRGNLICIDEPELGLHPDMIRGLAEGIEIASEESQFILSTHLENLLNQFYIEQIISVEKTDENSSAVSRYNREDFGKIAETHLPGSLWDHGHLGARRW